MAVVEVPLRTPVVVACVLPSDFLPHAAAVVHEAEETLDLKRGRGNVQLGQLSPREDRRQVSRGEGTGHQGVCLRAA